MSTATTNTTEAPKGQTKLLTAMVSLGAICALLIAFTYEGTKPRIAQLKAEALEKAIFQVIPEAATTAAFVYDPSSGFRLKEEGETAVVYGGYAEDGQLAGVAVEASGQGYADIIKVLYGYSPEQEAIIGFYVLESKETPGLGDRIMKDPGFLANFKELDAKIDGQGKTLANTIVTVKHGTKQSPWEIDAITGATISSRAVGDMLGISTNEWVPIIQQNLDQLKKTQ